MSHIVTMEIKVTNVASLDKAAKTLGFEKIKYIGYKAYYSKGSAFFGICEDKNGKIEFKTDPYYFKKVEELKQEYGKEELLRFARVKGLSIKSCKKDNKGEYQIEIYRG